MTSTSAAPTPWRCTSTARRCSVRARDHGEVRRAGLVWPIRSRPGRRPRSLRGRPPGEDAADRLRSAPFLLFDGGRGSE